MASTTVQDQELIQENEQKQEPVQEVTPEKKPARKPAAKKGKATPPKNENPLANRKQAGEFLAVMIHGHSNSKVIIGKLGDMEGYQLPVKRTALNIQTSNNFGEEGYTLVQGSQEWVGKYFRRSGTSYSDLMPTNDRGKIRYQLALLIDSVWDVLKDGDVIHYVGSVHLPRWMDQLRNAVNGTHVVKKGDITKSFTIKPYKIAVEGAGVIAFHKMSSKDQFSRPYLVDLGGGTAIGTPFLGYKLLDGAAPHPLVGHGIRDLVMELCSDPELMDRIDVDCPLNYFEVESALRKDCILTDRVTGNKADFSDLLEIKAVEKAKTVIQSLRNVQDRFIRDSDLLLATGGGLKIEPIRNVFKAEGFTIVKDPLWADCLGLYKLCQSQISKKGVEGAN
jgi:hypothetical protein